MAAKIKQEYDKFMNQMKNFGNQDEGRGSLTNMLGGLLKNFAAQTGMEGVHLFLSQDSSQIGKGFEEMFKNLKQDNLEQAAGKLLNQFMDKSLLNKPLIETKQNYDDFLKKQEGKFNKQDEERFKKQYEILNQIISILDKLHNKNKS